jgi:hypothetical protein
MDQVVKTLVDIRAHVLYCGVTLTGKTTLARHHANLLCKADYDVVVYDPVGTDTVNGGWPDGVEILTTPHAFHARIEKLEGEPDRPVFLFVDESADIFGHSNTEAHWIPRKCRHSNVYLRLIVQRPKMIHPSVRTQCAVAYILRLSKDDMAMLLADFGHGSDAVTILDTGDCNLVVSGSAAIEEFNVFDLVNRRRQSTTTEKDA